MWVSSAGINIETHYYCDFCAQFAANICLYECISLFSKAANQAKQ